MATARAVAECRQRDTWRAGLSGRTVSQRWWHSGQKEHSLLTRSYVTKARGELHRGHTTEIRGFGAGRRNHTIRTQSSERVQDTLFKTEHLASHKRSAICMRAARQCPGASPRRVPASLPLERAEGSAQEAVDETFQDRRATLCVAF